MAGFGIYGLGRMGQAIARRLLRQGHEVHVYNRSPDPIALLAKEGAQSAASLADLVGQLEAPRCIWLMLPAGEATDQAILALADLLSPGDVLVDGGNSNWRDAHRRAMLLEQRGVAFLDVGTSGGVHGVERGFCLMVGGPDEAIDILDPVFDSLSPGRSQESGGPTPPNPNPARRPGFVRTGASGSGHFVKMVHNGIEYGMMQAIAEGFDLLAATATPATRASEKFDLKLDAIADAWRSSSVISSWLIDLAAAALNSDPKLSALAGRIEDSGEGRWMLHDAIESNIPTPALASALFARIQSRRDNAFGNQLISAMRMGFGGHKEPPART